MSTKINGYEIINKIKDCDECEIIEFDFTDCFEALKEYEKLKDKNITTDNQT